MECSYVNQDTDLLLVYLSHNSAKTHRNTSLIYLFGQDRNFQKKQIRSMPMTEKT